MTRELVEAVTSSIVHNDEVTSARREFAEGKAQTSATVAWF